MAMLPNWSANSTRIPAAFFPQKMINWSYSSYGNAKDPDRQNHVEKEQSWRLTLNQFQNWLQSYIIKTGTNRGKTQVSMEQNWGSKINPHGSVPMTFRRMSRQSGAGAAERPHANDFISVVYRYQCKGVNGLHQLKLSDSQEDTGVNLRTQDQSTVSLIGHQKQEQPKEKRGNLVFMKIQKSLLQRTRSRK